MEHRTSAELEGFAAVIRPQKLSKKQLLERWALALEKRKGTRLYTLRETEYKPAKERSALQQENSPLTVAFADPVLRSAGLGSDRFGEVARFFGLSHWQLHDVVCNCHFLRSGRGSRTNSNTSHQIPAQAIEADSKGQAT